MRYVRCYVPVVCVLLLVSVVRGYEVKIDEKAGRVSLSARVAEQAEYEVLKGAIEYMLVAEGGKTYETVFVTDCKAVELLDALKRIGAKPGGPAADGKPPRGASLRVFVEYADSGKRVRRSADEFVLLKKTGKSLEPGTWVFTGSRMTLDPETEKRVLEASLTKSLIGLHYMDSSPLIQNPRVEAKQENIYSANVKALPKAGTKVWLILELVPREVPKGVRRAHVFISGRVQGVGFRNFTRRNALQLKLTGWVMNLKDGRVEAVIEGPIEKVAKLLEKVKRGPRAARVDRIKVTDEPFEGAFETFEVRYR